ncbi:molybdate ABC transporter substrate-binding protein [Anaerostipes sp.]|uniref:molybdate ABC transporter substrate-binding protein n=1 Tax=Anaerostipes sp. TaxID=1872530 RepID=UPI0025B81A9D|nr:molybdate ABC transporter substrate-binding protein [Anaerostipes sp.]MBS7007749.1 molybdate ABC transporter substrate-binding protein [Anaerostipes sp.]
MKKKKQMFAVLAAAVLSAALLSGCTSNDKKTGGKKTTTLTVSAAASLTDVTKDIAKKYKEKEPDVKLNFSYGSSGALQTQIEEGAEADIFMSAAQKQMDALSKKGLINKKSRTDLLENKLVLIVPKDSKTSIKSFEDLAKSSVKKVALGEPKSVPVGQYSEGVFKKLGILDKIKKKANYGSDVRQVLTWVESGEVDCGVVYMTDAKISDNVKVVCEAPEKAADPVIYPVAVLKDSKHQEQAQKFADYLKTDEILKLFESYGFQRVK